MFVCVRCSVNKEMSRENVENQKEEEASLAEFTAFQFVVNGMKLLQLPK